MGISGLLPLLKKASKNCHVRRLSGTTVAVDTYCWLHKGAFGCAAQLGKGEATTAYVTYCLKYVNILTSNGIKPILVFDGRNLPAKSVTEKKRRQKRDENRKKAQQYLREGKNKEAWECFTRCVDVTPAMARELIKVLRQQHIDYIIAPYEADAQLAYLSRNGIVDIVITEDSDLVLFGCSKIFFKMNVNGDGVLFEQSKLPACMGVTPTQFHMENFRRMCILSGCDYLPSLSGIGLGKAKKVFITPSSTDIRKILQSLPKLLQISISVSEEYIVGFIEAEQTFLYQLVFDPLSRTLVPLTPYPSGINPKELTFAGAYVDNTLALDMALGNVDIKTQERVDYFDPCSPKNGYRETSMWSKNYKISVRSAPILSSANQLKKEAAHSPTTGLTLSVSLGAKLKKRPIDCKSENEIDEDLISLYANSNEIRRDDDVIRTVKRLRLQNDSSTDETISDTEDLNITNWRGRTRRSSVGNPFIKSSESTIETVQKLENGSTICTRLALSPKKQVSKENKKFIVNSKYFKPKNPEAQHLVLSVEQCDTRNNSFGEGKSSPSRVTRSFYKSNSAELMTTSNSLGDSDADDDNDSVADMDGEVLSISTSQESQMVSDAKPTKRNGFIEAFSKAPILRLTPKESPRICSTITTPKVERPKISCRRMGLPKLRSFTNRGSTNQKSVLDMFAVQEKRKI